MGKRLIAETVKSKTSTNEVLDYESSGTTGRDIDSKCTGDAITLHHLQTANSLGKLSMTHQNIVIFSEQSSYPRNQSKFYDRSALPGDPCPIDKVSLSKLSLLSNFLLLCLSSPGQLSLQSLKYGVFLLIAEGLSSLVSFLLLFLPLVPSAPCQSPLAFPKILCSFLKLSCHNVLLVNSLLKFH